MVAPGVDVLSTLPNNETGLKDGTSMACPHVAGLAALILERNPRLTVTQVNDIIENNTKKVGPKGQINIMRHVKTVLGIVIMVMVSSMQNKH